MNDAFGYERSIHGPQDMVYSAGLGPQVHWQNGNDFSGVSSAAAMRSAATSLNTLPNLQQQLPPNLLAAAVEELAHARQQRVRQEVAAAQAAQLAQAQMVLSQMQQVQQQAQQALYEQQAPAPATQIMNWLQRNEHSAARLEDMLSQRYAENWSQTQQQQHADVGGLGSPGLMLRLASAGLTPQIVAALEQAGNQGLLTATLAGEVVPAAPLPTYAQPTPTQLLAPPARYQAQRPDGVPQQKQQKHKLQNQKQPQQQEHQQGRWAQQDQQPLDLQQQNVKQAGRNQNAGGTIKAGGQPQTNQQPATNPRDTLRHHLQEVRNQDPRRIFIARRINKLGFRSRAHLERYYGQYGPVLQVQVAHSRVKPLPGAPGGGHVRTRPGNFGLVVMKNAEDVNRIVADGVEQTVCGVGIQIQRFEKMTSFEAEIMGSECDTYSMVDESGYDSYRNEDMAAPVTFAASQRDDGAAESVASYSTGSGKDTQSGDITTTCNVNGTSSTAAGTSSNGTSSNGVNTESRSLQESSSGEDRGSSSMGSGSAGSGKKKSIDPLLRTVVEPRAPKSSLMAPPSNERSASSSSAATLVDQLSELVSMSHSNGPFTPERAEQTRELAQKAQYYLKKLEAEYEEKIQQLSVPAQAPPALWNANGSSQWPAQPLQANTPQGAWAAPGLTRSNLDIMGTQGMALGDIATLMNGQGKRAWGLAQGGLAAMGGASAVQPSVKLLQEVSKWTVDAAVGSEGKVLKQQPGGFASQDGSSPKAEVRGQSRGSQKSVAGDEFISKKSASQGNSSAACYVHYEFPAPEPAERRGRHGAGTLRDYLSELKGQDPDRIFTARRINKLGFRSREVLNAHYSQYGDVVQVLVAHSEVRPFRDVGGQLRTRPGGLGMIVMRDAASVKKILALGEEQIVGGHQIRVQEFERPGGLSMASEKNTQSLDFVCDEELPAPSSGNSNCVSGAGSGDAGDSSQCDSGAGSGDAGDSSQNIRTNKREGPKKTPSRSSDKTGSTRSPEKSEEGGSGSSERFKESEDNSDSSRSGDKELPTEQPC